MKLSQEVLFCCVISDVIKWGFTWWIALCSGIAALYGFVDLQWSSSILGEWDVWRCGSTLSHCLSDYKLPVLPHRGVRFEFFPQIGWTAQCSILNPAALHIRTFQRRRSLLAERAVCICWVAHAWPQASITSAQRLLATRLLYIVFSSNGYYSNTVLFIFQM